MENAKVLDNTYTKIKTLRIDNSYRIYLVRNNNNQNEYTAKVMMHDNQQLFDNDLQMTTIVSGLNNPNIIHLIGHGNGNITKNGNIIENNKNYLILDYQPKEDLFKYVFLTGGFSQLCSKYIFDRILRGVQAFHGAGICHRHLNLDNILINQNYNPIITGFEYATNNNVNALNDFIVDRGYSSPQIVEGQVYNGFRADIFSLGVILFYLVTGRKCFQNTDIHDINYSFIRNGQINNFWDNINIPNLPQAFQNLFIAMVSHNENNRPTIPQILQNPWLAEINNLNNVQQAQIHNEFLNKENQIKNTIMVNPDIKIKEDENDNK